MYARSRHLLCSLLALLTTLMTLAPSATHAAAPAGIWTMTGSMHQARAWHAATLLPSGLVLVAGRCPSTCATTATAEAFPPHTARSARPRPIHEPPPHLPATP